jgi:hypothetical protein
LIVLDGGLRFSDECLTRERLLNRYPADQRTREGAFTRRVTRDLRRAIALTWTYALHAYVIMECVAAARFAPERGTKPGSFAHTDSAWLVV